MASTSSASKTCSYKGRTYRLLWTGPTKYGQRAKLGFMDGSKEFWVDASAIGAARPASRPQYNSGAYCHECYACREARRQGKEACEQCMFDEYDN